MGLHENLYALQFLEVKSYFSKGKAILYIFNAPLKIPGFFFF